MASPRPPVSVRDRRDRLAPGLELSLGSGVQRPHSVPIWQWRVKMISGILWAYILQGLCSIVLIIGFVEVWATAILEPRVLRGDS